MGHYTVQQAYRAYSISKSAHYLKTHFEASGRKFFIDNKRDSVVETERGAVIAQNIL